MDAQYPLSMSAHFPGSNRQPVAPLLSYSSQIPPNPQPSSQTLPPLQAQRTAPNHANGLFNNSSQLQQPMYATSQPPYPNYAPQRIAPAGYQNAVPQYNNEPVGPQSSHLYGHGNYPQQVAQSQAPMLRPMPAGGVANPSMSYAQLQMSSASIPGLEDDNASRTHVVGSQGRRGILPSAAGRPAAVNPGVSSSGKPPAVPEKNSDGKFPCPHCNKTYLHAKHLKRHMLRHTGDRPYSCILCGDTFSRSDILKRHFQKCSIRRGNPTGATHLSHAQSHLKKQVSRKASVSNPTAPELPSPVSRASGSNTPAVDPSLNNAHGHRPAESPGTSSSGSVKRYSNGSHLSDQHNAPSQNPIPSNRATVPFVSRPADSLDHTVFGSRAQAHSGHYSQMSGPEPLGTFASVVGSLEMPYSRSSQPSRNSVPAQLGRTGYDWSYPSDPIENFASQMSSHVQPIGIKPESSNLKGSYVNNLEDQQEDIFRGLFPDSTFVREPDQAYNPWTQNPSSSYQLKSESLITFCRLDDLVALPGNLSENRWMVQWLCADNVEHFLGHYSHFQGHWPLVHVPTFNPFEAYNGLIMTLMCIGAVYSDRTTPSEVRILMERTRLLLHESEIGGYLQGVPVDPGYLERAGIRGIQELQAYAMLSALSIWHGDPIQRQQARERVPNHTNVIKRLGLVQPFPIGNPNFSFLHQRSPISEQILIDSWSWSAWIWQEQCVRLVMISYLLDSAMTLYFNAQPGFDPLEVRLPLPADDAAWEAETSDECAAALGLFGHSAQANNSTGNRRRKQPELSKAFKALMHPTYEFGTCSTNAYGKFILIHALHVQLFKIQQQISQGNAMFGFNDLSQHVNGGHTSVGHYEWAARNDGSTHTSNSNSGQVTPTDSSGTQSPAVPHHTLKGLSHALNKWKKTWDEDMPLQYPPEVKRLGWCRDGVHFFWLACAMMRNPHTADQTIAPDQRFMQVMATLKNVRTWVATDNAKRGEEIGSVAEIDDSYGVEDLTLDMRLLFAPLTPEFTTPASSDVHSSIGH